MAKKAAVRKKGNIRTNARARAVPKPRSQGSANQHLFDEIVWGFDRARILFRYWTMPLLTDAAHPDGTQKDTVSARAFAVLLIVWLTFAVRGDLANTKVSITVLAAAAAAALSFCLNLLSRTINVTVREPVLISAYASTILVMLGFPLVRATLDDTNLYSEYLSDRLGSPVAAIVTSVVVVYVLLCLKAFALDKNRPTLGSALIGLLTTLGSGCIVAIVYRLSPDQFKSVIDFVCRFGVCGKP